jgi:hypothetical protein
MSPREARQVLDPRPRGDEWGEVSVRSRETSCVKSGVPLREGAEAASATLSAHPANAGIQSLSGLAYEP